MTNDVVKAPRGAKLQFADALINMDLLLTTYGRNLGCKEMRMRLLHYMAGFLNLISNGTKQKYLIVTLKRLLF